MRRATKPFAASRGFTLIEMIIAMVIGGVIVAMASMFVRDQINASADVANRAALADAADTILRRMSRELQAALPNSVRVSGNFLEFIPVKDAGRYRAIGSATDKTLDFGSGATATQFDVFGPPITIAAGDALVIYNLGVTGADAYEATYRKSANATTGNVVTSSGGAFAFPFSSPGNRFQVIGNPVTFECDAIGQQIKRYTAYGFKNPQGTTGLGSAAILADGVTGCVFDYAPAVLQRNGMLSINLTLTRNGETVSLRHQVEVLNTP